MSYLKSNAYIDTAKAFAKLSKAKRLQVGSVLVRDGRVVSCGYNGCVSGGSNICEVLIRKVLVTKKDVIHAEANVILWAAKFGVKTSGCDLYTTHSPCFSCALMIVQCGIKNVYYAEDYRLDDGIEFLKNNNVKVMKVEY